MGIGKFQTPKMRSGREKFQADALASIGNVSQINDAAFLFLIGDGIDDLHLATQFHCFIQVDESALSIHDDRLARLAEFVAIGVEAAHLHADALKDARTAALLIICCRHRPIIVHQARIRVN